MANPLIDSDLLEHIDDETLLRAYVGTSWEPDDPLRTALRAEMVRRDLVA